MPGKQILRSAPSTSQGGSPNVSLDFMNYWATNQVSNNVFMEIPVGRIQLAKVLYLINLKFSIIILFIFTFVINCLPGKQITTKVILGPSLFI